MNSNWIALKLSLFMVIICCVDVTLTTYTCNTYHYIRMQYVKVWKAISYRQNTHVTVLLGGYVDPDSYASTRIIPHCFWFLEVLRLMVIKSSFLGNDQNKKQLIIMLFSILENNNIAGRQYCGIYVKWANPLFIMHNLWVCSLLQYTA